jgi:hypothetical protein
MMPTTWKAMQVLMPGTYCGLSFSGKTTAEMMPPSWPQLMAKAVRVPRLMFPTTWLTLGKC